MRIILLLFFLLCFVSLSFAGVLKGKVLDSNGNPLPFANVYVKNTTYGTTTNIEGEYFLELQKGEFTIVYSFVGYKAVEKQVKLVHSSSVVWLDVTLEEDVALLGGVEIIAKTRDRAKYIMKQVRERRKTFLQAVEKYKCEVYLKASLDAESMVKTKIDSLTVEHTPDDLLEERLKKEKLNLIETFSTIYFKAPNHFKEYVEATHDYAEVRNPVSQSITIGVEIGEEEITEEIGERGNPNLLYTSVLHSDFNFYRNKISYPAINAKPFISPLADAGNLSYKFDYKGNFIEDGKNILKIEVIPRYENEPLFYGTIFIEDTTFALRSVDLSVNEKALYYCSNFKIIQNYTSFDSSRYAPVRRELFYTIKSSKKTLKGNVRVHFSDYDFNPIFDRKTFGNEVKEFAVDAFDKEDAFWSDKRPLILKENEIELINEYDSLVALYTRPEYLMKIDSAFNKINIWSFLLTGIGHKNSFKGTEFRIRGLIQQVVPLGVGGYRHRLGGYFNKEFNNGNLLETQGQIDYGFRNKDVKGKVGVGLTYVPIKSLRTFIRVGDYYELINSSSSYTALFSRSNYARTKNFSIAQRMEVVNGLYAELTLSVQHQFSIAGLQLMDFSILAKDTAEARVINELNSPVEFPDYRKTEIDLALKYRFKQKYYIKKNKKIVLSTKYPTLGMKYRRGLPNLFGSEVDFEYIELSAEDFVRLPALGYFSWKVSTGTFTRKENLRVLEHKYFRGSDAGLFADPLNSFQLLGYKFDTRNEYFQANYIHHFEGALLNKVPLINKLRLQLVGGAGTLLIRDINFAHFEAFGGLERVFNVRLFGEYQPLRLGGYFVTSDNNLDKAQFRFKIGFDFYDASSKRWGY